MGAISTDITLALQLINYGTGVSEISNFEMNAVMAKYNPFADKAGMRKVAEQTLIQQVLKLANILKGLGFNLELLGNNSYVLQKLHELCPKDEKALRTALAKYKHPWFFKVFVGGMPYGDTKLYDEKVRSASTEQLATSPLLGRCESHPRRFLYAFDRVPRKLN